MTEKRGNPFPGLRPFEGQEAHLFFGRGKQVVQLVDRLRRTRFLAIVGASGCGKSSLIRAGLLPSLQGVESSPISRGDIPFQTFRDMVNGEEVDWRMVIMRPGDSPTGSLASALSEKGKIDDHWREEQRSVYGSIVETTLRGSSMGLVKAVKEARLPGNARVLILVDQFEELFRFWSHRDGRSFGDESKAFVSLLLNGVRDPDVPIYIIITMRSGYLGYCMVFPGLPEMISDSQYLVPRMSRNELLSSITGPPAVLDEKVAPRLAANLLNELGEDQDQLPILQHFLMRLWDRWGENHQGKGPLDFQHLKEGESIHDALGNHANQIYGQLKAEGKHDIVRKIFKVLTETNSEGLGIRRPVSLRQLHDITGESDKDIRAVIECFRAPGCCFLMPPVGTPLTENTIVDISHESLMRTWGRLKSWISEEENSARYYRRYLDVAQGWAKERKEVYLWADSHDDRLDFALAWQKENEPNAPWAALYTPDRDIELAENNYGLVENFIEESSKGRKKKEEELRADSERRELEKKNKYRKRVFFSVLGLLFSIGLVVDYLHQQNQDQKLAQAIMLRMLDVDDPLKQALVFLEKGKENELAAKELLNSFKGEMIPQDVFLLSDKISDKGPFKRLAISPDGSKVAIGTSKGTIHLWDRHRSLHRKPERKLFPIKESVTGLVFTGDGEGLIGTLSGGTVGYWSFSGKVKGGKPDDDDSIKSSIRSLAVSPDGKKIAYGLYAKNGKGGIQLLPFSATEPLSGLQDDWSYKLDSQIMALSFGENSIVGGALDGSVYLLPASSVDVKNDDWEPLFTLPKRNGPNPFISSVAQNDKGHIAIGSEDGLLYLLAPKGDPRNPCISEDLDRCLFEIDGYNCMMVKPAVNYGDVMGVGFWHGKPYGGYEDGTVRIWQCGENYGFHAYEPEIVLKGHQHPIVDITLDSQDDIMVSADPTEVRVWDLNQQVGGNIEITELDAAKLEVLRDRLENSTNVCLTASERNKYYQEEEAKAKRNAKDCREKR